MAYSFPVLPLETPLLRPLQIDAVQDRGRQFLLVRDPMGVLEGMAALPPDPLIIAILQNADGTKDAADIAAAAREMTGLIVTADKVRHIIKEMDAALLFYSEAFRDKWMARAEQYRALPVRPVSVFDTRDKLLLLKQLGDEMRRHKLGRNAPPERLELPSNNVRAILCPHIDYRRGGETYAWAYKAVADNSSAAPGKPVTFIILGTLHRPSGQLMIATDKAYDTPWGPVEVDRTMLAELAELYPHELREEEFLHLQEHTVELQVTYLKHVMGDRPFRILPLLVSSIDEILMLEPAVTPTESPEVRDICAALRTLLQRHSDAVLVGGVDFSHVGPEFGDDVLNSPEREAEVRAADDEALRAIEAIDATAFFDSFRPTLNERRVCSVAAIYIVLETLRGMGMSAKRLAYQQANNAERSCMVTFAAVAFCDKPKSRIILALD